MDRYDIDLRTCEACGITFDTPRDKEEHDEEAERLARIAEPETEEFSCRGPFTTERTNKMKNPTVKQTMLLQRLIATRKSGDTGEVVRLLTAEGKLDADMVRLLIDTLMKCPYRWKPGIYQSGPDGKLVKISLTKDGKRHYASQYDWDNNKWVYSAGLIDQLTDLRPYEVASATSGPMRLLPPKLPVR